MKPEDKELLLKDLCARLPYNVIVHIHDLDVVDYDNYLCEDTLAKMRANQITLKPYLRPLSSMTEEEDKERIQLGIWRSSQTNGYEVTGIHPDGISESYNSQGFRNALDFLLKKHFDIFGLIPKDLAIAVTKENNPYDTKEE